MWKAVGVVDMVFWMVFARRSRPQTTATRSSSCWKLHSSFVIRQQQGSLIPFPISHQFIGAAVANPRHIPTCIMNQ